MSLFWNIESEVDSQPHIFALWLKSSFILCKSVKIFSFWIYIYISSWAKFSNIYLRGWRTLFVEIRDLPLFNYKFCKIWERILFGGGGIWDDPLTWKDFASWYFIHINNVGKISSWSCGRVINPKCRKLLELFTLSRFNQRLNDSCCLSNKHIAFLKDLEQAIKPVLTDNFSRKEILYH